MKSRELQRKTSFQFTGLQVFTFLCSLLPKEYQIILFVSQPTSNEAEALLL